MWNNITGWQQPCVGLVRIEELTQYGAPLLALNLFIIRIQQTWEKDVGLKKKKGNLLFFILWIVLVLNKSVTSVGDR